MTDRFPGYDVLVKRDTPSWDQPTRDAIDARLALSDEADVLTALQRATLRAVAAGVVPQPRGRSPVNTVAILLDKIDRDAGDGFRPDGLPRFREAWERCLDALDIEARARHGAGLAELDGSTVNALLTCVERGRVEADWQQIDPKLFWKWRLLPDVVAAYWTHPFAWSAVGFGGPASPRGYVRLDANRRDPWEAAERSDGALLPARWRNHLVG